MSTRGGTGGKPSLWNFVKPGAKPGPSTAKPGTSEPKPGTSGVKPGTSGKAPSRGGSIRSGLTPYSEGDYDDGETYRTELSAIVARESYQPPRGYYSPTLSRFQRYLVDTQVQVIFRKLLRVLLGRPELPYNPYPGFYGRLRMHQERFHIEKEQDQKIMASLRNPLKHTYLQNLYTIQNYDNIYGLSSLLKVINPDALERYRWLLGNITPSLYDLQAEEDYSSQVMVALVGPCVFDGSFFPAAHSVQVRLEYVVTGPDTSPGISIFVNNVMNDIDAMIMSEHHFMLGVSIPAASAVNPEMWVKQYWEPEKIRSEKEMFLQKMSDAVIGNRYIYAECIFLLDPSFPSYIRGQKQYGLTFIELSDEVTETGLMSFCEFPMASLHEGVFFNRAHAEAYVSVFETQINDFETADAYDAGEGDPPSSPGIISMGHGTMEPVTNQDRVATARSNNQRFSQSQERNLQNVQKHVNRRLEQLKPRRVKIDGFRFGDEKSTGAFAWQITTPLKSYFQRKIATYWTTVDICEVLYCILLLVLMDREAYEETGIMTEIYRMLHGTVGRLYLLMEHNKGLRDIIQAVANSNAYPVIQLLLTTYKEAVIDIFLNPLLERSQDHISVGRSIVAKVEDMIYCQDMEFASATHLQFTLRGLKNINLYLTPLMMELAEDSLSLSPQVDDMIKKMVETFPDDDPRPPTRYKKRVTTSFKAGESEVSDEVISHGVEDEHIKRHETSVLSVKNCMIRDMSPQIMVKENVLMKYMLDCHFDDMWSDYLIDLAGGDVLPPNPFPRLITSLRQSAIRMDLFYEKPSVLTEKMFNLEVKLEDRENFIYHIPGLDAHGCVTSLMMLDTGVYNQIAKIVQSFQQTHFIQKKGPYRVGICLALSGPCLWYGRMQPYLNEIELHEHYYIQGPSGCHGEAIQLCSVVVHSHMVDMITKSGLPVFGVYFASSPSSSTHWTSDEIIANKRGFLAQFATSCNRRQPIYVKAYVVVDGWRYVTLTKYFRLHFLEEGVKPQIFYPEDHISYYLSVFLSKERAAFHYQNCGPPQGGDPMSPANVRALTHLLEKKMHEAQRKGDWLPFYRHLLLRDLITQDQSKIADCWRMFHSMAVQVEYVTGMMEVIQDLVITCLLLGVDVGKSRQSSSRKNKNPVDQSVLTKMVMAFYQKLMYVCEARLTMAAKSLTEYIENKLKSALEFDPDSGQPYLALEDQTIFRLEEMKSIMKIFQDILGGDVRSVCQDVEVKYVPQRLKTPQMLIGHLWQGAPQTAGNPPQSSRIPKRDDDPYLAEPDVHYRPESVASNMLDNPDFYKRKLNKNLMTVLE